MEGRLGNNHTGKLRRESGEAKTQKIIGEDLARLGWSPAELVLPRASDPVKLALTARNGITDTLRFNEANQLTSESFADALLAGLTVTSGYDTVLRRTSLTANTQPSTISQTFGIDPVSGRMQTATTGAQTTTYSYLANSALINQISFTRSGANKLTTTRVYDNLYRLQAISSTAAGGAVVSSGYQYNDANQRTRLTLADGTYWDYQYDAKGQVQSGKKRWADTGYVPGQQFEYTQDDIGNRTGSTGTKAGGDANGNNLRSAAYTPNDRNQYASRTVPSGVDITGTANTGATVTVNVSGQGATVYRQGEYYQAMGTVNNNGAAVYAPVNVTATQTGSTSQNGSLVVPSATQNFGCDNDGNLPSDGVWSFTWDAENRLTKMDCLVAGPAAQHLTFEYDWRGRRIRKLRTDAICSAASTAEDLTEAYMNGLMSEMKAASTGAASTIVLEEATRKAGVWPNQKI